ncbi:serine hydrolase domain-containing protein [soil metagenome]
MVNENLKMSSERLKSMQNKFAEDFKNEIIPGAVVLVGRFGSIQHFEALGYRDRENELMMERDSIFCLASISKLFTSVAAMMLVESGQLQLSEPVSRYLPKFKNLQVSVERQRFVQGDVVRALVPAAREMTIHDLLRHTSGLTYGEFGNSFVQQAYIKERVFDWNQTNAEFVEKLAGLPLAYHPGSTFEYGMSTDVLGHIIELVSGHSLDEFFQEKLCKPLRLQDTTFHLDDRQLRRLALPSPAKAAESETPIDLARPQHSKWLSGGGGLFSTALDVFRLMQMLLNGGQLDGAEILSRKTVQLMTCDHLSPNIGYGPYIEALQMTAPTPEMGQGFGLGFAVRTAQGRNPLPGSIGDFYWAGVSGTYVWADPVENLVGVLMLRAPAERIHYRSMIRQFVYQALVV